MVTDESIIVGVWFQAKAQGIEATAQHEHSDDTDNDARADLERQVVCLLFDTSRAKGQQHADEQVKYDKMINLLDSINKKLD